MTDITKIAEALRKYVEKGVAITAIDKADARALLAEYDAARQEPAAQAGSLQAEGLTEALERERFEHVMTDGGKWPRAVERSSGGHYLLAQTASAWLTWQGAWREARAALTREAGSATGAEPEDGFDAPCPNCNGSGESTEQDGNGPDAELVPCACPRCKGTGSMLAAYNAMSNELSKLWPEVHQLRYFHRYVKEYGWRAGQKSADEPAPTPTEPWAEYHPLDVPKETPNA